MSLSALNDYRIFDEFEMKDLQDLIAVRTRALEKSRIPTAGINIVKNQAHNQQQIKLKNLIIQRNLGGFGDDGQQSFKLELLKNPDGIPRLSLGKINFDHHRGILRRKSFSGGEENNRDLVIRGNYENNIALSAKHSQVPESNRGSGNCTSSNSSASSVRNNRRPTSGNNSDSIMSKMAQPKVQRINLKDVKSKVYSSSQSVVSNHSNTNPNGSGGSNGVEMGSKSSKLMNGKSTKSFDRDRDRFSPFSSARSDSSVDDSKVSVRRGAKKCKTVTEGSSNSISSSRPATVLSSAEDRTGRPKLTSSQSMRGSSNSIVSNFTSKTAPVKSNTTVTVRDSRNQPNGISRFSGPKCPTVIESSGSISSSSTIRNNVYKSSLSNLQHKNQLISSGTTGTSKLKSNGSCSKSSSGDRISSISGGSSMVKTAVSAKPKINSHLNSQREPLRDRNRMGPVSKSSSIDANGNDSPPPCPANEKDHIEHIEDDDILEEERHNRDHKLLQTESMQHHQHQVGGDNRMLVPSSSSGIESNSSNNSLTSASLSHGLHEELMNENNSLKEDNNALKEENSKLEGMVAQLLGQIEELVSKSKSNAVAFDAFTIVIQNADKKRTVAEEKLAREKKLFQVREQELEAKQLREIELLQTENARERECFEEEMESIRKAHLEESRILQELHIQELLKMKESHMEEMKLINHKYREQLNEHKKMSPHELLIKEIESLEAVVDLRKEEIRSLQKKLDEEKCKTEELGDLHELCKKYKAKVEEFEAKMEKSRSDKKELLEQIIFLQSENHTVAAEKSLLSQQKDELNYKIQALSSNDENFLYNNNERSSCMSRSVFEFGTPSELYKTANGESAMTGNLDMSKSTLYPCPVQHKGARQQLNFNFDENPQNSEKKKKTNNKIKSKGFLSSTPRSKDSSNSNSNHTNNPNPSAVPSVQETEDNRISISCIETAGNGHCGSGLTSLTSGCGYSDDDEGLMETSPISPEPSPITSPMSNPPQLHP